MEDIVAGVVGVEVYGWRWRGLCLMCRAMSVCQHCVRMYYHVPSMGLRSILYLFLCTIRCVIPTTEIHPDAFLLLCAPLGTISRISALCQDVFTICEITTADLRERYHQGKHDFFSRFSGERKEEPTVVFVSEIFQPLHLAELPPQSVLISVSLPLYLSKKLTLRLKLLALRVLYNVTHNAYYFTNPLCSFCCSSCSCCKRPHKWGWRGAQMKLFASYILLEVVSFSVGAV